MPMRVFVHSMKQEARQLKNFTVALVTCMLLERAEAVRAERERTRYTFINRSFRLGSHIRQDLLLCNRGICGGVYCLDDRLARPRRRAKDRPLLRCTAQIQLLLLLQERGLAGVGLNFLRWQSCTCTKALWLWLLQKSFSEENVKPYKASGCELQPRVWSTFAACSREASSCL